MHLLLVNYVYEQGLDAAALLDRYASLTGWAESLLAAGAGRVTVVQRFDRDADRACRGVDYLLRADGDGPRARPWTLPRRLHRAAAALRPDLVHVNGLQFASQISQLRRALPRRTALVVQDHGGVPVAAKRASLRQALLRSGLRAADAFMFTSTEQGEPWREASLIGASQPVYGVPEASRAMRALPREQARELSGIRGDPAILWVGHLDANKDPPTVLEGFARALPQLPGARLTMIYDKEDLMPALQERLTAMPLLAGRVELRGRVPHQAIAACFSAADIFVLGSHRESCGFALIEALLCGAAPVVTDIPSFRALTTGGMHGALWPPGDAAAFAKALAAIARQDLAGQRERIIAYAERELSWPAVGRRAMQVYTEVLKQRTKA
jgi:glycosyltransferase involved in cell wall biosynthesis